MPEALQVCIKGVVDRILPLLVFKSKFLELMKRNEEKVNKPDSSFT